MTPGTDPAELFTRRYHRPPTHRAEAPGRVNLLGEHIDYCGLPVLPAALQRRVTLTFRPGEDERVRLVNLDPAFEPVSFRAREPVVPDVPGHWGNYPKAAALALTRRFGELRGLDGVVSSTLPVAAGLSSSSALVVASALALVRTTGIEATPVELAEILAEGERFVGVQGGGMDQAIALTAVPGAALRIEFGPLATTPVSIPGRWRFLVASSLSRAAKSDRVREAYNERTRACARALGAVAGSLAPDDPPASWGELLAGWNEGELLQAGARVLDHGTLPRFRHVVTEAARVGKGEAALRDDDPRRFGVLMNASHRSLRDDYEVSTPALDELVALARDGGAEGARLTGAGFGGAILALSTTERIGQVLEHLEASFFGPREHSGHLRDHLFVVQPSGAAAVEVL